MENNSCRAPVTSPLHSAAFVPGTHRPLAAHFHDYVRRIGRPDKEWVPTMVDLAFSRNLLATPLFELAQDANRWSQSLTGIRIP